MVLSTAADARRSVERLLCRHNLVYISLCHNLQKLRFLFIFLEISKTLRYSNKAPQEMGGSNNFCFIIRRADPSRRRRVYGHGLAGGELTAVCIFEFKLEKTVCCVFQFPLIFYTLFGVFYCGGAAPAGALLPVCGHAGCCDRCEIGLEGHVYGQHHCAV